MSGEPGAGSILVGSVSEDLVCGRWRFDTRGVFVFVKSEESIRVDWSVVFARNETALHERQPYVFEKDVEHCVINEQCLYTKMSAGEIEMQKGEKCFAGAGGILRTGVSQILIS